MKQERWTLPNGMVCLYRRSADLPLVAGTLILRAGNISDPAPQAGLAHFTAQLLLQGTRGPRRRNSRQIADMVEKVGGSLGVQTSDDYTEIDFLAPAAEADRMLLIVSDVLRFPSFPAPEIAKERAHILASLRSRRDAIFHVAHDRLQPELFGEHPYGRLVEGSPEALATFGRRELNGWQKQFLSPERCILSLAGSQPFVEVRDTIRRHFGGWKRSTSKASVIVPSIPPLRPKRIPLKAAFEQAYLMTATLAPAAGEKDHRPLKLLNTVLGGGMSSRLFMRLREEMGLAYEVSSFFPTRVGKSHWVFYLGLPRERLSVAEAKLQELLAEVRDQGITAAELEQAKQVARGSFLMERQTRRRQAWYAAWWEYMGREPGYEERFLRDIADVDLKSVNDVASRLLAEPRVTVEVTS